MKKQLTKENKEIYYYKDDKKITIDRNDKNTYPSGLYGDITGLYGNISSGLYGNISSELYGDISGLYGKISSGLSGDITGLYGDITGLYGNISGLYGDCTSIKGNLDDCELTEDDRKKGINIVDLIN